MSDIKEFYVDTKGLKEQQIREVFAWSIAAGAMVDENVQHWLDHRNNYPYVGVDASGDTYSIRVGENPYIIGYDEVRKHLGLGEKVITEDTEVTLTAPVTFSEVSFELTDTITAVDFRTNGIFITHAPLDVVFEVKNVEDLSNVVTALKELDKYKINK